MDVRTAEERLFVGRVADSVHVPWATGLNLQRNPRFVREVEAKVRRDDVLLLICRSGGRSAAAATALTEARFRNAFNVLEGFEGNLDAAMQRGGQDGWRYQPAAVDPGLTGDRPPLPFLILGLRRRPAVQSAAGPASLKLITNAALSTLCYIHMLLGYVGHSEQAIECPDL